MKLLCSEVFILHKVVEEYIKVLQKEYHRRPNTEAIKTEIKARLNNKLRQKVVELDLHCVNAYVILAINTHDILVEDIVFDVKH
jgi:hypothetical protein